MKIINKVALAVFKEKQMLQVRTSNQEEDSDIECLKREVKEEIGCNIDEDSLKFLAEFEDVAHEDQGMLHIRMYEGELRGEPRPSSEIVEIGYFDSKSNPKNL